MGFPGGSEGKTSACNTGDLGLIPRLGRKWQPTPVLLPENIPWTEEPGGYNPWGRKELDTTEQLHVSPTA